MGPLFTSRAEWRELAPRGPRAYVGEAVGHVVRAALLGFGTLALVIGEVEPYWRTTPVLAIFAGALAAGAGVSAWLFRREWRAAARAYGTSPVATGAGIAPPRH